MEIIDNLPKDQGG